MTRRSLLLTAAVARAHGTHASRTLIDFVSATGEVQITFLLPAAELEDYLRFVTKRQLELDRDKDAPRLVFAELQKWLQLRGPKGQPLPLRWVGMRIEAQQVECFVETRTPQLAGATVRNTALIGWTAGWVNQVFARRDHSGPSWSHQFHQGKTAFATISWPPAAR